jgi:hypothetical protein
MRGLMVVRLLVDDDVAVSDMVWFKGLFSDFLVSGVWMVGVEWSDVLR